MTCRPLLPRRIIVQKRGIELGHNIPPETPEDLIRISNAFKYSKALLLANDIGVFTELADGALSAADLSAKTGVEAGMLEKLLIACASMGLLLLENDRFGNSLFADRYLVRGRPEFKGDGIAQTATWWERYDGIGKNAIEQYRAFKGEPTDADIHRRFIRAMDEFATVGDAELLAEAFDLSERRRLLDLGGGPGTYSVFFCRKNPALMATVSDLPETEPIFREVVESYGMADRVRFRPGDLEHDPIGDGYDAVLVSNMMHGYRGDTIPPLVFDALEPGGVMIVRDYILRSDKSGPLAAALFNLGMGAYTEDEIFDFLHAAGFRISGRMELGDHTVIAARKPGGV
jgi:hypothetical protein